MPASKRGLDLDEYTKKQGTNYLLAIAVNAYEHAPKLSNCVRDAEAIVEVLVSKYDFHKDNVTTLFDEEATRVNIDESLREMARKIKKEDNLLLYFAGHGVYDKIGRTGGYLVPVEAHPGKFSEFFSNVNFLNLIKAIESFHTFLLIDSCFSGSLFRSMEDNATKLAENVEHFPSRWGLAAGRIEEVEDGWHGDNSPFAKAVLQYLKSNTDAKFPASELVQYTKRVTPRNAKQTPVGGPLYKVGDLDGEFVFHLKKDEVADWQTASTTDTVAAYQIYLAAYPEGKHTNAANISIKKLSAAALWQKIENTPDENTFQINQKTRLIETFIKKYKHETHFRQVLREGEKMEWKEKFLRAGTSRYALMAFVEDNPPFFKEEAEKLLEEKQESNIRSDAFAAKQSGKAEKPVRMDVASGSEGRKPRTKAKATPSASPQGSPAKASSIRTGFFAKKIGIAVLALLLIIVIWNVMPKGGGDVPGNNEAVLGDSTEVVDTNLKVEERPTIEDEKPLPKPVEKIVKEPTEKENYPTPDLSYRFSGDQLRVTIKESKAPYTLILRKKSEIKYKKTFSDIGKYTIDISEYRKEAGQYMLIVKDGNEQSMIYTIRIDAPKQKEIETRTTVSSSIITNIKKNMKKISGGTFTMGCTSEQGGDCESDEKPSHKVTLSSYQINKYEVTQEEWRTVMGKNPSSFSDCDKCPVENVSWNDIQEFLKKLNKKTGKRYRLPTEAEWEYAARGGQNYKYAGSNTIGNVAWYDDNSGSKTHTVGGKNANGYGLYDMSGNVYEWCSDWYDGSYYQDCKDKGTVGNPKGAGSGSYRVIRGGSWSNYARGCRVSGRGYNAPSYRRDFIGFRLAHSL